MLTSDLFENKTPAAWRAGYERGLRYYRQGPDNPYPAGSQEAKDYADGYHNGELDSYDKYDTSTMNEGPLNEFAPGAGGDDDIGDDPYKYPKPKRYNRSADYFEQFEADHFDHEDFDDDTGVFKGYWGNTQIAYFKFDNPARTGGNNPGMGWYYEPQTDNRGDDTTAAPAADDSAQRKQQELSMINAFLKSGNRPNPDSQIGRLMKKHGLAEGNDYSAVTNAVTRRIIQQHPQVLAKYGPVVVGQAIDEIAEFVGDVDEIGSSDVSGWTSQVIRSLARFAPLGEQGVSEGEGNREMWDRVRSKGVVPGIDREKYTERPGLEGPFSTKSGKVVYYDKQEGKYYDPGTDFYISHDDYQAMNEQGVVEDSDSETNYDGNLLVSLIQNYTPQSYAGKLIKQDLNDPDSLPFHLADVVGLIDEIFYESLENGSEGVVLPDEKQDLRFFYQAAKKSKKQGVAEDQLTEQDLAEAVSTLELADILFKGLEQKFPKIIERYGHEVVGNAIMDVAEENLDVNSFSEIDMLIDDIIEKLQNYNGNDLGLTESTVSRLYYNVVGTSAPELRKDFGMRHDRQGWFLSESSGRNRIMDAQRAFGSPKLVEYSVSDATGGAAQLGPDNVVSPVGSVPKSQRINTKKARK